MDAPSSRWRRSAGMPIPWGLFMGMCDIAGVAMGMAFASTIGYIECEIMHEAGAPRCKGVLELAWS